MNCEQMMESMQRFVDEDLTQTEEQSLMNHISQCPDCAASFEQLQRLSAELSLLPMVVPPFSIVDSILPRLAELDAQQAAIHAAYLPTATQRKKPVFSWKIAAGFVAAAAIFVLVAVNLSPSSNFDASEMIKVGSATKSSAKQDLANGAKGNGAEKATPELPMAASKDSDPASVDNFTMDKADTIQKDQPSDVKQEYLTPTDKSLSTGTNNSKPEATADKLQVTFGVGENAKKSQKLAPQPSPSPTPAPTAHDHMALSDASTPAPANQTLASDDGNFIGVIERQIVQVQTPDGNRIYTSSITWKSTDTIRLLLWQDNQRLTYEVKMEDGLVKRFIVDPILKTEQEQKIN